MPTTALPPRGPKTLAFYLPQFHPIPENDEWWGKGFTEWTNVTQARPLFRGHYQPHIPQDLGFYDLRLPEVLSQQAEMALSHCVDGFVFYHYWFSGRRILDRPLREFLSRDEPEISFCLCWANESWTRTWDGRGDTLLQQEYSDTDDVAHIRSLLPALSDRRYVTVDQKPLLLIYKAQHLPSPRRTTDTWRREAAAFGLPGLFICRVEAWPKDRGDPRPLGFDAAVEFQPDFWRLGPRIGFENRWSRAARRLRPTGPAAANQFYSYDAVVELAVSQRQVGFPRYRCVTPSWDNTARRRDGGARVLLGATPEKYEAWSRAAFQSAVDNGDELVFINAWNEWGEGNHLEPDLRWGHGYLDAHVAARRSILTSDE